MKEYPEEMVLEEIWEHFKNWPMANVATIDGKFPRVRPMALIEHNFTLWFATQTLFEKVDQIKKNSNTEVVVLHRGEKSFGSIRITGQLEIVSDSMTKKEVIESIPWFEGYWSSHEDENFTLLRLHIDMIRYDNPDDGKKYSIVI